MVVCRPNRLPFAILNFCQFLFSINFPNKNKLKTTQSNTSSIRVVRCLTVRRSRNGSCRNAVLPIWHLYKDWFTRVSTQYRCSAEGQLCFSANKEFHWTIQLFWNYRAQLFVFFFVFAFIWCYRNNIWLSCWFFLCLFFLEHPSSSYLQRKQNCTRHAALIVWIVPLRIATVVVRCKWTTPYVFWKRKQLQFVHCKWSGQSLTFK